MDVLYSSSGMKAMRNLSKIPPGKLYFLLYFLPVDFPEAIQAHAPP